MHPFKNPSWISELHLSYVSFSDIPDDLIPEINYYLDQLNSDQPTVSIVIPAWNEEVNIIRTLYTLAKNKTSFPVEILVINNLSTDNTQKVLDQLHVRSYIQYQQGCGPARQLGQEKALGKYILMADADCFYPEQWIEAMMTELRKENVACVYGHHSFLGTENKQRWKLFIYELLRDILVELRHIKRPYLNALGMSMGYVKEFGLKAGFVDSTIRGEDGRMCFDLMRFGKIKQVRGHSNRVWTLPRTLDKENNLFVSLLTRIVLESSKIGGYFFERSPHNTKASSNERTSLSGYLKKVFNRSAKK